MTTRTRKTAQKTSNFSFLYICCRKKKVPISVQFKRRCTFEVPNWNVLSWGNFKFSLHVLHNAEFTLVYYLRLLSFQKSNCQMNCLVYNGVKKFKIKLQYGQSTSKFAQVVHETLTYWRRGTQAVLKVNTLIKKKKPFARFQGNKRNSLFDLYINKCKDFLHYFGWFCKSFSN